MLAASLLARGDLAGQVPPLPLRAGLAEESDGKFPGFSPGSSNYDWPEKRRAERRAPHRSLVSEFDSCKTHDTPPLFQGFGGRLHDRVSRGNDDLRELAAAMKQYLRMYSGGFYQYPCQCAFNKEY